MQMNLCISMENQIFEKILLDLIYFSQNAIMNNKVFDPNEIKLQTVNKMIIDTIWGYDQSECICSFSLYPAQIYLEVLSQN